MIELQILDMSMLASRHPCTSVYQNGGQRYGVEMETQLVQQPVPTQRRYTLNADFYNVLEEVGAVKEQPYEWKDVIMLFIRYLAKRKPSLIDPTNKSRVLCSGDPLGRVFGVECFTKEQTRLLVRQNVSLVEDELLYASLPPLPPVTGPPPELEPVKRGPDSPDDPGSKRSRPEPEPEEAGAGAGPSAEPSAEPAGGAAPSPPAAALHRMDTLEVTDDGGDDGAPDEAEDSGDDRRKTYALEMEPVECTDVSDSDGSDSGESDIESPLSLTMVAVWVDDGMLADMETSESDSENRDKWTCPAAGCQHANSARKSRCDRCWKTRPAWVVGPRTRRKKRRHRDQVRQRGAGGALSAGPSSQPAAETGSVGSQDTGFGSQETSGSAPSPPPPPAAEQTCIICYDKPRNAAIIHGRTGCQVTCYACARKLWKKNDLCPSCRRTIEKIVFMRFG